MLASILWIDGRNSRMKWWLTNLGITLGLIFTAAILFNFSASDLAAMKQGSVATVILLIAALLVYLGLCLLSGWISIISDIRRLHDLNKSGWWSLVYYAPALTLGFLFKIYGRDIGTSSAPIGLLVFLLFVAPLWRLIELGFFPGAEGDNDFGPPSGLSGTIDLDEEIEGLMKASGRMAAELQPKANPAPAPAPRVTYASTGAQGTGFGKRR